MSARPRPPGHSRFSSAVQSGTACGWKPGPSSVTRSQNRSRADFAFDLDLLRFVEPVAVPDRVGERFFERHLDAEIDRGPSQPSRSSSWRISSMQRHVRTLAAGQLLSRGPTPAMLRHAVNSPPTAIKSRRSRTQMLHVDGRSSESSLGNGSHLDRGQRIGLVVLDDEQLRQFRDGEDFVNLRTNIRQASARPRAA